MKKLLAIFSFAILAAATLPAQAGFLVDPYLGYETGTIKSDTGSSDTTGTTIGARLGYSMMGFWGGVDVSSSNQTSDSGTTTTDNTILDMSVAGGYEFPVLIRAYAAYTLSSAMTFDGGSANGTGLKLGVGYTGLPFVAVNLEMVTREYKTADIDLLGEVDVNSKGTTTMLSVSMPLDF